MAKKRKIIYIIQILLLLICIGICSFFIYYFYKLRNTQVNSKKLIANENYTMTYMVKYKNNDFYNIISDDNDYLVNLIDDINIDFSYANSFSKYVTGTYTYQINGYLLSDNPNFKSEVYKGEINNFDINGNVLNLSNNFNIDFDSIINNYNDFSNTYNVKLKPYIRYEIIINYDVYNDYIKDSVSNSKTLYVDIPIDNTNTSITTSDASKNKIVYYEQNNKGISVFKIICYELSGADLLFILMIIFLTYRMNDKKSPFDKKLNYYLSTYDDMIVNIKDIPNLAKYNILFVHDFDDIVDAAENANVPINYIKVVEHKEVIFVVLKEKNAYVYKFNEKMVGDKNDKKII